MGKIVEGLWDCMYCSKKGIGGGIRVCPGCGKPRDKDTKFYLPNQIKYVDEEKANTISKEPDWICQFCDSLNAETYDVCQYCGAQRTSENLNYFENRKKTDGEKYSEIQKPNNSEAKQLENFNFHQFYSKDNEVGIKDSESFELEEKNQNLMKQTDEFNEFDEFDEFDESDESDEFEKSDEFNKSDKVVEDASEKANSNGNALNEADFSKIYNEKRKSKIQNSKFKSGLKAIADTCSGFFEDYFENFIKGSIIIGLIIATVLGIIWIFSPKTQTITVDNVYWERCIDIERYQTVDEEGWSLPDGARLHESKVEIYTYKQVVDHYEHKSRQVSKRRISHYEEKVVGYRDLGNGHFEEITKSEPVYETYYETEYYEEPVYRKEPVYKTKYYYEIDKWLFDRTLETYGYDKSPYWEDISHLKSDERAADRKEKYYIKGTNSKGKYKEIEMSYDEWCDVMVGDVVKVKVSIFGKGKIS